MEVKNLNLVVSPVPHIRSKVTTRTLMLNVIIALLPALVAATIIFGPRVLLITGVSVASCVVFELLIGKIRKRTVRTIVDLSAIVTGMLLAFNMPVTIPVYVPVIGSVIAIVITKELFGGLGRNFANPAIVGRIALAVSFPALMTNYVYPTPYAACDALTSATPLALNGTKIPIPDLLLGTHGGVIGETCAIALLIGLVWLLATRTIDITIPFVFIATVAVMSLIFGYDVLQQILSGGLLLGAIFMATDYVTSPFTRKGKFIFALGCGIITCIIRFWGNMNEGVSYAILLMNLLVPIINSKTRPAPLGGKTEK